VEVHDGLEVDGVGAEAVNQGEGEAPEVDLAVFAPDLGPAFRFGLDAAQGVLELVQEVVSQSRLALVIP
jgi:hypothetical protein